MCARDSMTHSVHLSVRPSVHSKHLAVFFAAPAHPHATSAHIYGLVFYFLYVIGLATGNYKQLRISCARIGTFWCLCAMKTRNSSSFALCLVSIYCIHIVFLPPFKSLIKFVTHNGLMYTFIHIYMYRLTDRTTDRPIDRPTSLPTNRPHFPFLLL